MSVISRVAVNLKWEIVENQGLGVRSQLQIPDSTTVSRLTLHAAELMNGNVSHEGRLNRLSFPDATAHWGGLLWISSYS